MCGIRRHPHRFKFGIFAELPSIKERRHAPFCGFAKYFSKYLTRCQGIQLLVYPVSVVVTAMLPSKTLVSQGKCCYIPVKLGVRGISPPSLLMHSIAFKDFRLSGHLVSNINRNHPIFLTYTHAISYLIAVPLMTQ